jgi:hypothetical protein
LQLLRETGLQLSDLRVLDRVALAARGVGLEVFDLVLDAGVEHLCLRDHALQSARGSGIVGARYRLLVQRRDLANVRRESANVGFDCFDAREEVGI